jgi:hypothetical protein
MTQRQTATRTGDVNQRTSPAPHQQAHSGPQASASPDQLIQTAATRPQTLTTSAGAQLQRTIGNHALGRVLASAPAFPGRPRTVFQAKLQVGPAGDKYEQEADQVADSVMRNLAPATLSAPGEPNDDPVQRTPIIWRWSRYDDLEASVGAEGGPVTRSFENTLQRARGSGQPIETSLRSRMEAGMGAGLANVRVHTDSQADSLSRSVSARAFTSGPDIFFRSGEYNPGSSSGQRLLAHELTHVVQQGAATQSAQRTPDEIQRKDKKKGAGDIGALEQGLVPNFAPASNAAPANYQVTVGVARVLPEFLPFAKERMKSTIRNKARAKLRSVPLLKGLVRKAKTGDEIKTKAAKRAVSRVKENEGATDTTASQQEINNVIANSDSTGHSWIKFSALDNAGQPIKTYSFGFYASAAPARPTDVVAGEVHNPDTYFEDSGDNRYLDTRVNAAKYAQGLDKAVQLKANPPAYTTIGYNCTKFVREVAKAAGASFPSGAHMMIPFSNVGQIRLFQKAFAPNALYDKIEDSGKGYEDSPESQKLGSGQYQMNAQTGQIEQLTIQQQQAQQQMQQQRTQAGTANIIRDNKDRIGEMDKQEWLNLGLTSDRLEDLKDETIGELVEDEVDVAGVFATFELDIPQVALIAAGKMGKVIKAFSAPTLFGRQNNNIPVGSVVRVSKAKDGEVQFEVARMGQYKLEMSKFIEYVDMSGS